VVLVAVAPVAMFAKLWLIRNALANPVMFVVGAPICQGSVVPEVGVQGVVTPGVGVMDINCCSAQTPATVVTSLTVTNWFPVVLLQGVGITASIAAAGLV
jgi:hypothetical protein